MPLVREIAESIKLLGDVVKSTREIVEAVNDGSKYLKRYYPEAQGDLSSLLRQMQRAIEGLANVTKVISGFRFVVAGNSVARATAERDLARLNRYLIEQRKKAASLRGSIRKLKADCDKVRKLRDKLDARTKTHTWGSMFELFSSKARKRSQELSSALSNFYADDQQMIKLLSDSLDLAEKALAEVENALGPPGIQNPYNVPIAAQILGLYAVLFRTTDQQLDTLADDLNNARIAIAS
jgi:chromosome segregation ATPase